ncbi:MAG TPA: TetR/AcrR family transcriptional regulator [Chthoniobacteraceae bacterium]|jgi:AcrR family transcriptional regulator|nr:TetR/AcrR family transcriptional regulator [Chthoniobacteraceae bacterium]
MVGVANIAANADGDVPALDTRALILEVARTHLRRFGQDKMTIIGIARALGMSHANVYRYFPSKTAVVDAVLDAWLGRVENLLKEITRRDGTAAERIERLVMEIHGRRRAKFRQEPELFESFRRVIVSRPDAVAKRQEKIAGVFQRLIEQGIEDGEFEPVDPSEMADVLEDATAFFLHPAVMPSALSNRGEERASNVVRRILAGISTSGAATLPERGIRSQTTHF